MYRYAVAGAGLQGTAIAYDLGLHGNAKKILLIDTSGDRALSSAKRVNNLLGKNIVSGIRLDVRETGMFIRLLQDEDIQTLICAMRYELNNLMTWVATKTKILISRFFLFIKTCQGYLQACLREIATHLIDFYVFAKHYPIPPFVMGLPNPG